MKTVFDKRVRLELIERANALNEHSTARWGKMNVHQMLKHCTLWEEMMLGRTKKYRQTFMGFLFGKMVLKSMLKDDSPLPRNMPSSPGLIVTECEGNLTLQKMKWVALIEEYEEFSNAGFVHPFFGRMTKEQIGRLAYKHSDHHLRQFGS